MLHSTSKVSQNEDTKNPNVAHAKLRYIQPKTNRFRDPDEIPLDSMINRLVCLLPLELRGAYYPGCIVVDSLDLGSWGIFWVTFFLGRLWTMLEIFELAV